MRIHQHARPFPQLFKLLQLSKRCRMANVAAAIAEAVEAMEAADAAVIQGDAPLIEDGEDEEPAEPARDDGGAGDDQAIQADPADPAVPAVQAQGALVPAGEKVVARSMRQEIAEGSWLQWAVRLSTCAWKVCCSSRQRCSGTQSRCRRPRASSVRSTIPRVTSPGLSSASTLCWTASTRMGSRTLRTSKPFAQVLGCLKAFFSCQNKTVGQGEVCNLRFYFPKRSTRFASGFTLPASERHIVETARDLLAKIPAGGGVPQRFMVVTLISIHSEWFWFYWWCVMLAWVMPYRVWIELRGLKRETAIVSFPSFLWLSCRPSSGSTWSSSPKCRSMTATLSAMCCFSHMWWMGQPEAINCQCQPRTGRV